MKVLFAVSNEEISEAIVKRYQKQYKEIISYKNVYYFNAILKEIQKDKTYDRIVISEELEAFTNAQYEQIDRFIFDKLDGISDEAANARGDNTPIILICSDRRTKGEDMLVKLFGIGIYDALIGNDRGIEEVCNLIYKPRSKKDAKLYYKIEADEVKYQSENENDVSEQEIQNILAHYKKLGKNEEKYVTSFDNIVAQYNDAQLRIISKFLPLNVRAVLEEKSPKYQQVMSFNNSVTDSIRKTKNREQNLGPSGTLLKPKNKTVMPTEPIVIPNSVNERNVKKLSRNSSQNINNGIQNYDEDKDIFVNDNQNIDDQYIENYFNDNFEQDNNQVNTFSNNTSNNTTDNDKADSFGSNNTQNNQFENNSNQYNSFGNNNNQYNPFENDNTLNNQFGNNSNQYDSFGNNNNQYNPFENNNTLNNQFENNSNQYDPFGNNNNQYDPFGNNNSQYDTLSNNNNQYDPFANGSNQYDSITPNMQGNMIGEEINTNRNKQEEKTEDNVQVQQTPKRRGRPRKKTVEPKEDILPGFEDTNNEADNMFGNTLNNEESILPGFDSNNKSSEFNTLPGFEGNGLQDNMLPGFDNASDNYENEQYRNNQFDFNSFNETQEQVNNENRLFDNNSFGNNQYDYNQFNNNNQIGNNNLANNQYENNQLNSNQSGNNNLANNQYKNSQFNSNQFDNNQFSNNNFANNQFDNSSFTNNQYNNNQFGGTQTMRYDNSGSDLTRLLTENKRIVTFVGTSKNGTSFIVNNLAEYASSIGINVAIFDTTKNKNSYYIYTKNEEELRQVAGKCLEGLSNGQAKGISVNRNLTVYTSLPEDREELNNVTTNLATLVRVHDLILIDCDFETPMEYFANSSETYLVQSLDILTIQPLTAFLRELKAHSMLDQSKLKILLNKNVKVRGISDKTIVGGMSKYNDPAMSFMTDLFDVNAVKCMSIQFEQDIYTRYLESVINCDVSIKGYSKTFIQTLKELCGWVYPSIPGNNSYRPQAPMYSNTTFSTNMNNTLNQMKRKY